MLKLTNDRKTAIIMMSILTDGNNSMKMHVALGCVAKLLQQEQASWCYDQGIL